MNGKYEFEMYKIRLLLYKCNSYDYNMNISSKCLWFSYNF